MKGKKLLTLLSIFAGAAVVGTTFAAWAVTDNADPFGIKVSPGTIKDDEVSTVTLSYGDSSFQNLEGIKAGVPSLAGAVELKAETSDKAAYTGIFSIKLVEKKNLDPTLKLRDHLTVQVFKDEVTVNTETGAAVITGLTPIATVPTTGDNPYEASVKVTTVAGVDSNVQKVWVVVTLDSTLTQEQVIKLGEDIVYVEMDWNLDPETEAQASTIYLTKGSGGEELYCYAWGATSKNGEYPGVKMNDLGGGVYSYELGNNYDKVIFTNNIEGEGGFKTEDLTIGSDQRDDTKTPNYRAEGEIGWTAKPDIGLTGDYFVTSEAKGNWRPAQDYALEAVTGEGKHADYQIASVEFAAGEAFKICNKARTVWFSNASIWENCGFTLEDGNIKVTEAGNYKVELYVNGDNGNCVVLTKLAA